MKKLLLMRHAIAQDREIFATTGQQDALRPLTPEGIEKCQTVCKKLTRLDLNIKTVLQSPLLRSQQTADIVCRYFKNVNLVTVKSLHPEMPLNDLVKDLNKYDSQVLAIGHEPHLSQLAGLLLCNSPNNEFLKFKKSGVACFSYENNIEAQKMQLDWWLTPKLCN